MQKKRIQVLLRESTTDAVRAMAEEEDTSLSAMTARLVEEAMTFRKALTVRKQTAVDLPQFDHPPAAMTKWVSTPEQFWYQ